MSSAEHGWIAVGAAVDFHDQYHSLKEAAVSQMTSALRTPTDESDQLVQETLLGARAAFMAIDHKLREAIAQATSLSQSMREHLLSSERESEENLIARLTAVLRAELPAHRARLFSAAATGALDQAKAQLGALSARSDFMELGAVSGERVAAIVESGRVKLSELSVHYQVDDDSLRAVLVRLNELRAENARAHLKVKLAILIGAFVAVLLVVWLCSIVRRKGNRHTV